jgi:hypothetical protein
MHHPRSNAAGRHQQLTRFPDGYISFPDFEKFCQSPEYDRQHGQNNAVKT